MTKESLQNIAALIGFVVVFQVISASIGHMTMPDAWYADLTKSTLNPPGWVFGVVWTGLYALLAVSAWMIWTRRDEYVVAPALMLFGLHMVLNWAWSFIFFTFHLLAVSFFWIVAIFALAVTIFFIFRNIRPAAAYLLIPYLGWLCFAAYLCFFIWQNNSLDLLGADAMVPPAQVPEF